MDRQEPNRPKEIVGDKCGEKEEDCIRVITQNINGIVQKANNLKEQSLKAFIWKYNIDILGIQ